MLNEIEAHFEEILLITENLTELLEGIAREVDISGREELENIKRLWQGDNAAAFAGKEARIYEDIYTSVTGLKEEVRKIRQKAQRLYEAEQNNVILAKLRKY